MASVLARVEGETELRNIIGGWLRDNARGRYTTVQEEELADAKRPDIRFFGNGFDAPVPLELKIVEKWTGPELFERLENQLCNNYLRDHRSRNGIFLLVHLRSERKKQHKWQHPETRKRLGFKEICGALQESAACYIGNRVDIDMIEVVGIDLTIRAQPMRPAQ